MLPVNQAHFYFWLFHSGITILSMQDQQVWYNSFIFKLLELFVRQEVQI
jgi:hypothetical protein